MDPRFQTSFIPKKPIIAQARSIAPSSINLITLIATILFIVVLALAGAAFFYKGLLAKQIAEDKATLGRARDAFDPKLIAQIVRLDTRIETANRLMASHISVDPLFEFISSITLQSVRFRDFGFSYAGPDKILVSMTGQAKNYASVALQSDELYKQKSFQNVKIGDMALDQAGNISFTVSATVDSKLLSYSAAFKGVKPTEPKATTTQTQ
jgi:hypothetical protein